MKKLSSFLMIAILGGAISLGGYKFFLEEEPQQATLPQNTLPQTQQITHSVTDFSENTDFRKAAEETVHAVVHVKNVAVYERYNDIRGFFQRQQQPETQKAIQGAGSGVIITPDGYIVTNNHVIDGANELQVTLNNNITYKAEVVGTAPQSDIALLKIDAEDLDYIPFGDSNSAKIGDWVLAVGNPFNLTSTVTAGIISAKGRDLNEGDTQLQSFIQTDAAINPGNSGGALVNTNGELIGINTAITSRTGSYIGYGFAVPSNNARKIVEDLLEYGDVRQARIGITGGTLNPEAAKNKDLEITQGVYVSKVQDNARKAGLREGDLITEVDGVRIRKLSDLTAYIGTKRPESTVEVNYFRNGNERTAKVTLIEYVTYPLQFAGIEITNADKSFLKAFDVDHGVAISRALSQNINIKTDKIIITEINEQKVHSVADAKKIIESASARVPIKITFRSISGIEESYTFRP